MPESIPDPDLDIDLCGFRDDKRIAEQQAKYVRYFIRAPGPVVDLGCGRGIMLRLLKDAGVECYGVDRFCKALEVCRSRGLEVVDDEVREHLEHLPCESVGGIVCSHLVEHFPPADVVAKFHLIELPFYAGLLWYLLGSMGIAGVALAWTLRATIDAFLLFGASCWLRVVSARTLLQNGILRSIIGLAIFALAASMSVFFARALEAQVVLAALFLLLFALGSWAFLLDNEDRGFLVSAWGRVSALFERAR